LVEAVVALKDPGMTDHFAIRNSHVKVYFVFAKKWRDARPGKTEKTPSRTLFILT